MGIQSLPNLENAGSKPALRLVSKRDGGDVLLFGEPLDNRVRGNDEQRENLACARGVLMAFGFQAVAFILGIAFWKLHFLVR
jgi:hypothetical protein